MVLKKNNSTTAITGGRNLWNFLSYRTIQVRIYTVPIGDRVRDVAEWPGVGAGIRGVNVEYPYVSITRL